MDYPLHRSPVAHIGQGRIIPPRPKQGERQPRPYSLADLNALWATAHSLDWQAMVTVNPPPSKRITTWPDLRDTLSALKTTLTNWHRRKGFPAMIAVTEFDSDGIDGDFWANFHIGCASALSDEQQKIFTEWWLARCSLADNRGRAFQHDTKNGGKGFQDYLAKDIKSKGGIRRHVKFSAPWLPERTDKRLWFVVGCKRRPAREGAKLCALKGLRRRRFDSEHGKIQSSPLTASTGSSDSEHAPAFITADVAQHHSEQFRNTRTLTSIAIQPHEVGSPPCVNSSSEDLIHNTHTSKKGSDLSKGHSQASVRGLILLTLTIHFSTCSLGLGALISAPQSDGRQK